MRCIFSLVYCIANFKETDLFKVFQTGDLGNYYNSYYNNNNDNNDDDDNKLQRLKLSKSNHHQTMKKQKQKTKHQHHQLPPKMPQLLALLKSIYSIKFRDFIRLF